MSDSDFSIDPWTQVYDRLWQRLAGNGLFATLVKPGNRINFQDANPDPAKLIVNDSDWPQVKIVQTGGPINPWRTDSTATLVEGYRIEVSVGDNRPNKMLNRVKWAILQAIGGAEDNLGVPFVLNVTLRSGEDARDAKANGGTMGWSSVLSVIVEMQVPRAVLKGTV